MCITAKGTRLWALFTRVSQSHRNQRIWVSGLLYGFNWPTIISVSLLQTNHILTSGFYANKATVKRNIAVKCLLTLVAERDSAKTAAGDRESDSTLGQLVSVSLHTYPPLFTWPSQGNQLKAFNKGYFYAVFSKPCVQHERHAKFGRQNVWIQSCRVQNLIKINTRIK